MKNPGVGLMQVCELCGGLIRRVGRGYSADHVSGSCSAIDLARVRRDIRRTIEWLADRWAEGQ